MFASLARRGFDAAMNPTPRLPTEHDALLALNRRRFLTTAGTVTAGLTLLPSAALRSAEADHRIKIGLIGCGGRGRWITNLFARHGGYEVVGVFDYFPDRANQAGDQFKVPAAARHTGLYGYRKLLEQPGLDAVVIQSPPFFHPEQAQDAVAAGKHVYLAKPIAVDVPGCQSIAASGAQATAKRLVFLADFQTRANPAYQEVVQRVREGQIGKLVLGEATYHCGPTFPQLKDALKGRENDPEARLRAWGIDRVLSGDVITEQNIHALDVATWFTDSDPVRATGTGGLARGFGTCWDHFAVIFWFPGDLLVSFNSKQMGHGHDDILCRMYGTQGTVDTHYAGKVSLSAIDDGFNGNSANLYETGAVANIAAFHDRIVKADYTNATVAPSVRSNLTTILGRLAAYEQRMVTWDEMMRRAERWEFRTEGLKL